MLYIQTQHGHQPQLFHLVLQIGVGGIEFGWGEVSRPGGVDHSQAKQVEHHRPSGKKQGAAAGRPLLRQKAFGQQSQQEGGQEKQDQQRQGGPEGREQNAGVVAQPVVGGGLQGAEGIVGLKGALGEKLGGKQQGEKGGEGHRQPPVDVGGEEKGEKSQQTPCRQGEEGIDGEVDHVRSPGQMENRLQIDQKQGKIDPQGPGGEPGPRRRWGDMLPLIGMRVRQFHGKPPVLI